jgi:hypothetical protein
VTSPRSHQDEGQVSAELVKPEESATTDSAAGRDGALDVPRTAGIGPFTIRTRITSPALQGLIALAAYLAVWVTARAYPLVLHPERAQLNQANMDPNFYVWSLRWWPYAISHGLNPLYSTEILAPMGHGLAWVTTIPPLALLLSPVTEAAGPVVSYNVLAAIAVPTAAWAAFVLCRRLTGRFWPALAGGAVYGFSTYEMNHTAAGQLNLTFTLLLPLMAYLVLLWRDGKIGSRAFVGLLALAVVLQFYLFLETFADMTAVWAIALLLGYALAGSSGRPVVARLSRRVGLAYLITIVFAAPYLAYALAHVPKGFTRSPGVGAMDLASLVVPRPGRTFGLSWLARYAALTPHQAAEGYVGIPLLAIAVALAVFTWSRKTTRFLFVLLVFIILAALGPALTVDGHRVTRLPWARIWYLPIVRSAFPGRFMILAFLVLAVMVALWLAGPSRRPWARWLLAVLAIAAIAADVTPMYLPHQPGLPAFITTGEYHHYLTGGETVVVVSRRGNAGMLWQAETNFYTRLAGGYINEAITRRIDLPRPVQNLDHATRLNIRQFGFFLNKANVAAILVEAGSAPKWAGVFHRIGLHGQAIGGVILYRIAPQVRHELEQRAT